MNDDSIIDKILGVLGFTLIALLCYAHGSEDAGTLAALIAVVVFLVALVTSDKTK